MMKTDNKKKVLLKILENLFNENLEDITWFNCIGFYNFLLDNLEFEARYLPFNEKEYYNFLKIIIDLLSNFNQYIELDNKMEDTFNNKESLKKYISNNTTLTKIENFDIFLEKINGIYMCIKDDFLL